MPQATVIHVPPGLIAIVCSASIFLSQPGESHAQADARSSRPRQSSADVLSRPSDFADLELAQAEASRAEAERETDLDIQLITRGVSSNVARKEAIASLPIRHMSEPSRKLAEDVLRNQSLFRRLPTVAFDTDPDVYLFFATHPDVAVSIWRTMEISKFEMWQTGPDSYEADAGDGSLGLVEVLHRSRESNVIFCDGQYKSPLLVKPIHARSLLHLQSTYSLDKSGQQVVTHYADLFVSFPSQTVETAAKLISPVSNVIADRNFREISLFVKMMSLAMQNQPGWVERIAEQLEGVLPLRRTQLLKLAAQVYVSARKERIERSPNAGTLTLDDVIRPLRSASQQGRNTEGLAPTQIGDRPSSPMLR